MRGTGDNDSAVEHATAGVSKSISKSWSQALRLKSYRQLPLAWALQVWQLLQLYESLISIALSQMLPPPLFYDKTSVQLNVLKAKSTKLLKVLTVQWAVDGVAQLGGLSGTSTGKHRLAFHSGGWLKLASIVKVTGWGQKLNSDKTIPC